MDLRNPARSVESAFTAAKDRDLLGVPVAGYRRLPDGERRADGTRRPRQQECTVVMFSQDWLVRDIGMRQAEGASGLTQADTVVVTGPQGDACVYASGMLMYHVFKPNRRFFLDVMAMQMKPWDESAAYDGRDSPELEALDYEAVAALARLRGALRLAEADDGSAERVARLLVVLATEIREAAGPGRRLCA